MLAGFDAAAWTKYTSFLEGMVGDKHLTHDSHQCRFYHMVLIMRLEQPAQHVP